MVLTVTTSRTRCQHMIDYLVERAEPVLVQHFLFAAKTEFGPNWKVPGVMRDLFTASWQQADTSFFRIDQG